MWQLVYLFFLFAATILYILKMKKIDKAIQAAAQRAEKFTQALPLWVQWVIVLTSATVLLVELIAHVIR